MKDFPYPSSVVTIGVFDGLHLGHQEIIRQTIDYARRIKTKSGLLTFKPHPQEVIANRKVELITSYKQKRELIAKLGIDIYSELKFSPSFASLSAEGFIKKILVNKFTLLNPAERESAIGGLFNRVKIKGLVLGADYHFGRNREGDVRLIQSLGKKYNFDVVIVPSVKLNEQVVSSSLIRSFIKAGDFQQANKFLGRDWQICGRVFKALSRGRTLGYPTANVRYPTEILLPQGVFAAEIILDSANEKKRGIVNIGSRPTFSPRTKEKNLDRSPRSRFGEAGRQASLEVHIFDFQKEIYGDKIELILKHKIRNEQKFPGKKELVQQIKKDEQEAKRYWG